MATISRSCLLQNLACVASNRHSCLMKWNLPSSECCLVHRNRRSCEILRRMDSFLHSVRPLTVIDATSISLDTNLNANLNSHVPLSSDWELLVWLPFHPPSHCVPVESTATLAHPLTHIHRTFRDCGISVVAPCHTLRHVLRSFWLCD